MAGKRTNVNKMVIVVEQITPRKGIGPIGGRAEGDVDERVASGQGCI